ncbi:MAG: NifB/NifX family molybdenum-iron cluster-binding protein [Bacteroidales bacterium]
MNNNTHTTHFAFATDKNHQLIPKHFGDAELFVIYKWESSQFVYVNEIINPYKESEKTQHGDKNKGYDITHELQKHNVHVLVSKQFGTNISIINYAFIPIIVSENNIQIACNILSKHITWIIDELKNNPEFHKLFIIQNGVVKKNIVKSHPSAKT